MAKKLRRPRSHVSKCGSGERRVDVVELTEFARLYWMDLEHFVNKRIARWTHREEEP